MSAFKDNDTRGKDWLEAELADTLDDVRNFTKVLSAITALLGLVTRVLAV